MMAKRRKAFRRAALRLSAAAWRRHVFIAMIIARMIFESFASKLFVWQRNQ